MTENKIKKTIPLTIASAIIQHLRINLTKELPSSVFKLVLLNYKYC